MTEARASGERDGLGVPWICETCGHFTVLHDGGDVSESVCRDADGPHRLTAYTGTEAEITVLSRGRYRLAL